MKKPAEKQKKNKKRRNGIKQNLEPSKRFISQRFGVMWSFTVLNFIIIHAKALMC